MLFLGMINRHNANSSMRSWTDQWQSHDASSLGWSTVLLVTCDGELACKGGLINGGKQCFFLVWSTAATQRYFYQSWVKWLTAETWRFFSRLVEGSAAYVQRQISVGGRTDQSSERQNLDLAKWILTADQIFFIYYIELRKSKFIKKQFLYSVQKRRQYWAAFIPITSFCHPLGDYQNWAKWFIPGFIPE